MGKFNYEEETRNDYLISKQMKKIWAIQLELVNKVLDVCKRNNLTIFADGGTLLGVIRHGGYIPWDDDIDLAMKREDYNKLCEIADKEFDDLYFFQSEETDPGSVRGHVQIRKSDTTAILNSERNMNCRFNQGIFIDIIPLDAIPNNEFIRKIYLRRLNKKKQNSIKFRNLTQCYRNEKEIGRAHV